MTEAVTAIESLSGKHILVPAPSSPSVKVLRTQEFTTAETLQQFQVNTDLQEIVGIIRIRGRMSAASRAYRLPPVFKIDAAYLTKLDEKQTIAGSLHRSKISKDL